MPEMYFVVKWPNGEQEQCYSPSLVIQELLKPGATYPVYEFMERTRAGLRIAAERVRAKYGFYCSAALDQLSSLETQAQRHQPGELMQVVSFSEKEPR